MIAPTVSHAAAQRRELLQARFPGPSLIPAGRARARNYRANTFPFRASSHFLYLVGVPIEGAALWLDGEHACLLLEPSDPDADLWHGPVATAAELSASTGLEVKTLSDCAALARGRGVATLPQFDAGEANELARLLARDPHSLGHADLDQPLLEALISLRLCHDEAALRELQRAADVSVAAHRAGLRATRPGLKERDVRAVMELAFTRAGFTTAYGSIVTVHGEVLHNHRHDQLLNAGDLLLADVGAESDTGYASDITRTWPVSGHFSASQRTIYELVLAMQQAAIAAVRPGVRYRDLHMIAARVLVDGLVQLGVLRGEVDALVEDGAQALFFPHGIGHLLGLDVHDMEDLGDRAGYAAGRVRSKQFGLSYLRLDRELAPGMLVTIEPGFYQVPSLLRDPARIGLREDILDRTQLAAFSDVRGIRIEDDVLITSAGSDVLTKALPKSALEIEQAMRAGD